MKVATVFRRPRALQPPSLCLAGLLLVATACSSALNDPAADSTDSVSVVSTSDASTEVDTERRGPLERALEEAFGYALSDIEWASERAVAELVADCMIGRGWEYRHSVPERFDPSSIERRTAGEQARFDLEQGEASAEAGAEDPPEYDNDEHECWQNAIDEVPELASSARDWLYSQTEGLYDRVSGDPRVVDAEIAEERCVAGAGYDAATLNDMRNAFTEEAYTIFVSVRSGEVDSEAAFEELDELGAEERRIWDATDRCIEARLEVERTVARELEAKWLEDYGDRLAVAVAELKDDLAELSDQLAAIAAES